MTPPVAVLLAGGLARRMGGGDKPLRLLAGRSLLDHVIDRVAPQVQAMVLNANGDPARFAAWTLPVVPDTLPGNPGPLAGILAGMRWAAAHAPGAALLSVPTDTPFLPPDLAARLQDARQTHGVPIACAASGGHVHPVVALWDPALADALAAAIAAGARKVQAWADRQGVVVSVFDISEYDPFMNVNTPADLESARQMFQK